MTFVPLEEKNLWLPLSGNEDLKICSQSGFYWDLREVLPKSLELNTTEMHPFKSFPFLTFLFSAHSLLLYASVWKHLKVSWQLGKPSHSKSSFFNIVRPTCDLPEWSSDPEDLGSWILKVWRKAFFKDLRILNPENFIFWNFQGVGSSNP